MRRSITLLTALAVTAFVGDTAAQDFTFEPPGELPPGSGQGRADDTIFAPTMLFPIQDIPAYANSQVWGHGGSQGPGGGQCDVENYSYPWVDNYCETRSWDMPLCPSGNGHQGQDIRPKTCDDGVHPAVAAESGTITNIGSFSVYVTADDGTRYDYLHMSDVAVTLGQEVQRGDVLGMVSNEFGGTPTTIHLHFNIRQNVMGVGTVYVPPYTSLINAYQKLLDRPIDGALEAVGCDAIVGWAFDPDDREAPVDVPMVFDGSGVAYDVRADVYRGDLCENLSFCEHGFDVPPPFSLFDGASHEVDATSDVGSLAGSPLALQCEPPVLDGARRPLSEVVYDGWGLTAFWDEPPVEPDEVEELPVGDAFPEAPELWVVDDAYFVVDGEVVRAIGERALRAWRFDAAGAEPHEAGELAEGEAWPDRPLVVRDGAGDVFVVDVLGPSDAPSSSSAGAGGAGSSTEGDVTGGCSCGTAGTRASGSWAWWLAAMVLLGRRRRSRSQRG